MAIEGPLRELGIHDVFQLLDLSRKTGVLRVTSQLRRNHGTIYFDSGAVVAAEVRSNRHRLGALLVRAGKVTEAELELAKDTQARGDPRRLGEILVDLDAISQRELERQVQLQVEEVIFEIMGWREGYFSFSEGPIGDLPAEAIVRIPTEALLMEGARRIDEWSRIERQIPHLGVVPVLAVPDGPDGRGLDLLPDEWEVLAAVDGTADLRAMASALGRSEFDVARTVFGLQSAGIVTVQDPGPEAARAGSDFGAVLEHVHTLLAGGDVDGARLEVETLTSAHPRDPGVHLAAARVFLAAGRPHDAEEASRRALRLDSMLIAAHRTLGDALVRQGRFSDGADWWERWLAIARHEGAGAGAGAGSDDAHRVRGAIDAARTLAATFGEGHG